jgi:hypothetical protein
MKEKSFEGTPDAEEASWRRWPWIRSQRRNDAKNRRSVRAAPRAAAGLPTTVNDKRIVFVGFDDAN